MYQPMVLVSYKPMNTMVLVGLLVMVMHFLHAGSKHIPSDLVVEHWPQLLRAAHLLMSCRYMPCGHCSDA